MATSDETEDLRAIKELIGAHFDALRWSPGTPIDWRTFTDDFLPDASLFPAARPVVRRTLEEFMKRMDGVAQGGSLNTFEEKTLGMQVLHFGNIAVVLAASEMLENGTEVNHDVSGYLLVKNEGKWRIAAHAWDKATSEKPVPEPLQHAERQGGLS
jgi:hypothetical protein